MIALKKKKSPVVLVLVLFGAIYQPFRQVHWVMVIISCCPHRLVSVASPARGGGT